MTTRTPGAALAEDVRGAISNLVETTHELTEAITDLSDAAGMQTGWAEQLASAETEVRADLFASGAIPGKNEAERRAQLDVALLRDERLRQIRDDLGSATAYRQEAQRRYDVAYRRQQAARAILAALTALVGQEREP